MLFVEIFAEQIKIEFLTSLIIQYEVRSSRFTRSYK